MDFPEESKKDWRELDTDTVLGLRDMLDDQAKRKSENMDPLILMMMQMWKLDVSEDIESHIEADRVYAEALKEQVAQLDAWLFLRPDYGQAVARSKQKKLEHDQRRKAEEQFSKSQRDPTNPRDYYRGA